MIRGDFLPRVERVVEGAVDGFLNLRAAEIDGSGGHRFQIEARNVTAPFGQVNAEDLLPFLRRRQIHEEDFIQPALAEQLRR